MKLHSYTSHPTRSRTRRALIGVASLALVAAACGSDGSSPADTTAGSADTTVAEGTTTTADTSDTTEAAAEATTTTAAAEAEAMTILVSNDDGYETEGIDSVVQALLTLPDVEVTVVAPLENQSGSSDSVSPDEEGERPTSEVETASGYPATAVDGTPGDSIIWALANIFADGAPDLIVSGSNEGENIGPFAQLSGTVGATRIGARQGIPGLAISQGGVAVEPEFDNGIGAGHLVDWITENRDAILASEATPAEVWSINVPSCAGNGEVRDYVEVPLADAFDEAAGEEAFVVDCASTLEDPDDDVTAFVNGYATLTQIPETLVIANP